MITAWGIVPLMADNTERGPGLRADDLEGVHLEREGSLGPMKGVLVVAGSNERTYNAAMPRILASIGTRDAVAMDGSTSVMMGSKAEHFLRHPPLSKQKIQKYGFYCS